MKQNFFGLVLLSYILMKIKILITYNHPYTAYLGPPILSRFKVSDAILLYYCVVDVKLLPLCYAIMASLILIYIMPLHILPKRTHINGWFGSWEV